MRETDRAMTMPTWWDETRFGLLIHATVASVPAWAPVGENAEWYRSHLGEDVADVVLHPHTMVEVLAHHRDRWSHVERYDDFVPLLDFSEFDAEEWAALAREAGAGYSVLVTKHHDGWAWWDAPGRANRLTEHGPRRNIVAEYAAACERNELAFGTYYSLLDWGDPAYPGDPYIADGLHAHVLDLVARFGSTYLWGDGHWGHDASTWRTAELLRRVREVSPEVVVNDRWRAAHSDVPDGSPSIVQTFEHDPPDAIVDGPWELTRSIGHSFGYNRAESASDHLTGTEIVDLFTETVAKGGHLLLNVGAASDGTIPADQATPLRDAGRWIRRHHELLARSTPWTTWGDRATRYLSDTDGSLIAIDVHGGGVFAALGSGEHRVTSIDRIDPDGDTPVAFAQEPARLLIDTNNAPTNGVGSVAVYRIVHEPAEAPAELFSQPDAEPIDLAPLLLDALPGSIIQLSDGTYFGPVHVPDRVTLRGLGAHRTIITCAPATEASNTAAPPIVTLGDHAHLEHVRIAGRETRPDRSTAPVVSITGGGSGVLGGRIDGTIEVVADGTSITATRSSRVIAVGANGLRISRCSFVGNRVDVGADIRGGRGHRIESSEFGAHLCSIRLTGTTGATVRGNTISGRWWGVHADHTDDTHVHANRIRSTMRAVDIDGGAHAVVDGNSVSAGDSGCVVEDGAADCEVSGNHWDRCRIGLLTWGSVNLHHHDNVASDLRDPDGAHVTGP